MIARLRKNAVLVCVFLVASLVSSANVSAQEDFKKPLRRMALNDGDSIVFLGDSITHQCLYTQYVEDFLYTRFPSKRFMIHNAGVGGARAWDALQRFDEDAARTKALERLHVLHEPFDSAPVQLQLDAKNGASA